MSMVKIINSCMNFYDNKYISEFCEDTLELKILQLRKIKENSLESINILLN